LVAVIKPDKRNDGQDDDQGHQELLIFANDGEHLKMWGGIGKNDRFFLKSEALCAKWLAP
jgi:hypothetical protein